MRRIEDSSNVDRTAKEVWEYVADPTTWPKWASSYLELKQTSTGPIALGATFRSIHPKNRELNESLVELDPERSIAFEFTSGPIKGSRVSFRTRDVEGAGGRSQTQLTRVFDLKFSGLFKLLGPLLIAPGFRREGRTEVDRLKQLLEEQNSDPGTGQS
jgi:hypothetical protein